MRSLALVPALAASLACSRVAELDDDLPVCEEGATVVAFEDDDPIYVEIHRAVLDLPREFGHEARWRGEGVPITVTTTVSLVGDTYELSVLDLGGPCSIGIAVPVHVTVRTDDGALLIDQPATWSQPGLTQPSDGAADITLGARLSTPPATSSWLTPPVTQRWPDIASSDDDAELVLELSERDGELCGQLDYSKREFDQTTVFYELTPLLEWGGA